MTTSNIGRALCAAAFIVLPLLVGALSFRLTAPPTAPGVYLEVLGSGGSQIFPLPAHVPGTTDSSPAAVARAGVLPIDRPVSLVVVQSPRSVGDQPPITTLRVSVTDATDPAFEVPAVEVAATIRRMHGRSYRVTSAELSTLWDRDRTAFRQYERALDHGSRVRSGLSAILEVAVRDDPTAPLRVYRISLGSPPIR